MPSKATRRAQSLAARRSRKPSVAEDAATEGDSIAAFLKQFQSVPLPASLPQQDSEHPAKRVKTSGHGVVTVAREYLSLPIPEAPGFDYGELVTSRDASNIVALQVCPADSSNFLVPSSDFQLVIRPRMKSRDSNFYLSFPLQDGTLSPTLRAALTVAQTQGVDPGDEGCIWAAVEMSVQRHGPGISLDLSLEIRWNEQVTVWSSKKAATSPQETLRNIVVATWYPELALPKDKSTLLSWSPQDFYEAAYVPDKRTFDAEVSGMKVPRLEAKLYPFQRRAVQWLLKREGVQWSQEAHNGEGGVVPCPSSDSTELPISWSKAQDVDGNTFYLSPLLGAITTDPDLFHALEGPPGGILAEEMGLGKTLEVISLMLLHPRPDTSVMVFDHFLGRELLASSATLIVTPTTLLDQWLSEIRRHAPTINVLFYPGIRKATKEGQELSAEYLAQQDVIVTTYEVLRTEIWAASDEPGRSMRNAKQYESVKSPLVQVSWWRVCIDEAQMVENWSTNAAQLARRIPRLNAWGVTGTPVKDDIQKDLRGLLLFLRYDLFAHPGKVWNLLTTRDKQSFRELFRSLSMRHTKAMVKSEISIPPQKRYVITMPFTAVEEQHYQSLFEELAATCGLDPQGSPLSDDWDPGDPAVQSAMRIALDRLRQTALHPEVGSRNRRALGQKSAPMRTVMEVLGAMLEQSEAAMRTDQRTLLTWQLARGQILACQRRVKDALSLWKEVLEKATGWVAECRQQLEGAQREARNAQKNNKSTPRSDHDDDDDDDDDESDETERDDLGSAQVGEARRRLRSALEIQHTAVFFCGNAYFTIKTDETLTVKDSDEFKELEKLEVESYDSAKKIRKEILQESHKKATKLMEHLAHRAAEQRFAEIPEFKPPSQSGLETNRIVEALTDIGGALDEQANQLDDWREHIIQLLLKPLVDEDNDEVTGEEYEQSTKLQDEILVYLQVLRTALADRSAAVTGQKNFLVEHETKVAARMAANGDGPFPEKLLQLLAVREAIKPPFVEGQALSSLRGVVSELRGLTLKLRQDAAAGSSRAAAELEIANALLKSTTSHQTDQAKAVASMEKETEKCMDTLNARLEFYRQLQEVSDMVGDYEGSREEAALRSALQTADKQERTLQGKLAAAEAKHRYLIHLKETESGSEESKTCIICQSTFSIGVLTVCGHQFCKECITLWWKAHRKCPVCKKQLNSNNLHDITLKPQELKLHPESATAPVSSSNPNDKLPSSPTGSSKPTPTTTTIYSAFNPEKLSQIKSIDLPSSGPTYTTKVDTLLRHLLWLRSSDPGAKSIVFSQYKEFLEVLALAFKRYQIGYTSFDKPNGISSFKSDPSLEVFLLSARAHSSGLNLVNASHVFLCEPILNTALELQAIARVDRIGQEQETTVWLYLVEGTVEEGIYDLSVKRRLEHLGQGKKNGTRESNGKGKEKDVVVDDLEEANSLEMQQAKLGRLMGRDGVIAGEVVDEKDLWSCLFGHLKRGQQQGGGGGDRRLVENPVTRGFLAAEAAEERIAIRNGGEGRA
ncbi:SNF2 family N-terminal domain-containing protein [Apiosordaria backusii]|uniref:SNF2 family N-terminal domain-containing protein n=1 Tax=Apiosordaria backusii TaxID=314023 RepID=A0AA40BRU6_9PEZI|nr:SNF2 family N-terminal domain-containing protein [Apiosordaria backusii]